MRKIFVVGKVDEALKDSRLEQTQVIAYRQDNQLQYQNLDFYPKDRFKLDYDSARGECKITIQMNNGDFLAIGNMPGLAEKGKI